MSEVLKRKRVNRIYSVFDARPWLERVPEDGYEWRECYACLGNYEAYSYEYQSCGDLFIDFCAKELCFYQSCGDLFIDFCAKELCFYQSCGDLFIDFCAKELCESFFLLTRDPSVEHLGIGRNRDYPSIYMEDDQSLPDCVDGMRWELCTECYGFFEVDKSTELQRLKACLKFWQEDLRMCCNCGELDRDARIFDPPISDVICPACYWMYMGSKLDKIDVISVGS